MYLIVLEGCQQGATTFYVGKSNNVRQRARQHVRTWFTAPHSGYWIPTDADAFLRDPVAVINARAGAGGLENRNETQRRIREKSWLCAATPDLSGENHLLEHIEYALQEAVRCHAVITVAGYIGDAGYRKQPSTDLTITSSFDRPWLRAALPESIHFQAFRVTF